MTIRSAENMDRQWRFAGLDAMHAHTRQHTPEEFAILTDEY